MKCPSEIELNDYSEDRLSTARRWEVEAHLRDCPGCRADLEGLDWAATALGALLADDVPDVIHPSDEDLAALKEGRLRGPERKAILKHLGECPECAQIFGALPREQRVLPLVRSWQPLAAAASLLIIVGFIFFVARGQFSPEAALTPPPARHAEVTRPPEVPQAVAPGASATHTDGLKATAGAGEEPPATKRPPPDVAPKPHRDARRSKPTVPTVTPRPHAPPRRAVEAPPVLPERTVADMMVPPTPAPSSDAMALVSKSAPPAPAVVLMPGTRGGAGRPLDVAAGQPEAAPPPPVLDRPRHTVGEAGVPKMAPPEPAERVTNRLCPADGLASNQKPASVALAPPKLGVPLATGMPGMPAMPATATRAPGGFSTMSTGHAARPAAGGGMPAAPSALVLTNRLLLNPEWLAQVRSDPQVKTQVKALLRQMLQEEQSGARREAIGRALLALDPPAAPLRRIGAVARLLKRA